MEKIEGPIKKLIILFIIMHILLIIVGTMVVLPSIVSHITIQEKTNSDIPHYTIVEEEDLSYSSVVVWQVRATTIDDLTKDEIKSVAKDIVKRIKEKMKVNAISIFLYNEGDDIHWIYTIASIDYAPYGDWPRADEVNTGDYSKHTYHIEYA